MSFTLIAILSLCIVVTAIIAIARFHKINERYYPFVYCVWLGAINEILSVTLVLNQQTNVINTNIYILAESLLLTWQFKKWQLFGTKPHWFIVVVACLLSLWLWENFYFSTIRSFDSYFRIGYSALIMFMSINIINHLIVTERRSLVKNPTFILCTAFVLFYAMTVLSEAFWIYGIPGSKHFRMALTDITVITNFIAIILYTLSVIWMPIKQRFTLPSS